MNTLIAVVAVYFLASLAHFSHNAEFIAFYPGLIANVTVLSCSPRPNSAALSGREAL